MKEIDICDKISLDKKVVNINWSSDKVAVKCEDLSEFSADHVIVTTPLGVLKKLHKSMFTPPLPDAKIKAIGAIGYGAIGKFFIEFKENVLPDGIRHITFLWTESDLRDIRGSDKEW